MKVIGLWSGGKDSCFANYKAMSMGYEIKAFLNFTKINARVSLSHGLSSEIIRRQAKMNQIPVVQKPMPQENYRREFKNLITTWKKEKGISGIVFGDIYLEEHRDWIDKVCQELKVKAILPLWKKDTQQLILEIIDCGIEAIVVSTRADILGKEWLGRKINRKFVKELDSRIDPCGEKGEFHTFVYSCPFFRKPIEFVIGKKIRKDTHWYLELK